MARGLAARMARLIVVGAGLALAVVVLASHLSARRLLERELEGKASALALATARRIETVERSVEKVALALARELVFHRMQPAEARPLLRTIVRENEEVFGAAFALEPGEGGRAPAPAAAYIYRKPGAPGGLAEADLASSGYQYQRQAWYRVPRQRGRALWSEPYFDQGGGEILMSTYSVPLLEPGKRLLGVATTDLSLEWLSELLSALPLGERGYAFIISGNGTFVAHRDRALIMKETIFSVAAARADEPLRRIGERMLRGEVGFVPVQSFIHRRPSYLAFTPIRTTGWSLGIILPQGEVLAPVQWMTLIQVGLGVAGFAALLLVVVGITRRVTRPLRELAQATRQLGAGHLEAPLPEVGGQDEVAELAGALSTMRRDLRLYLQELAATTAAKERLEGELRVAREIQLGLLPRALDLTPEVELAAVLEPAREIGGDLYDCFLEGGEHLAVLIADVAGKGVPAALLMARTGALARVFAREDPQVGPASVLARLNEELARDNDAAMFVTLCYARLELASGRCVYASAGHPSPLLRRAEGEVAPLPRHAGLVLGALPGVSFEEGEVTLRPGDLLLLYTDGVTEAVSPTGELFSEGRLVQELRDAGAAGSRELVDRVRARVREHAAGAPPSDDLALLALRFLASTHGLPRGRHAG